MAVVVHSYISRRDARSRVPGKVPKVVAVERALAHVKYIQNRPGRDKADGKARQFFDEFKSGLDGKDLRKMIKLMEDSRVVVHKLTLAPEIEPLSKEAYTREVMDKIAREKGLDLNWMAVSHGNTDHAHIHVVVLGKDKKGKMVWLGKEDYPKLREYGDTYLERWQPLELERSRQERERRDREKLAERQKQRELARQERILEGLELPWLHKKIVREMYEPYRDWKDKDVERVKSTERESASKAPENAERLKTIRAAGKVWSRQNSLAELQALNEYLWDNYDERIPKPRYKELVSWIKEKEEVEASRKQGAETRSDKVKDKDSISYLRQEYTKDSTYYSLRELADKIHSGKAPRLPVEDYQKLRKWMESADRQRWSGIVEKQLELSKAQYAKEGAQKNMPHMQRAQNPIQEQALRNPVIGLFMTGASVANELVRWIPVTDQRDRLKEAADALQEEKLDRHKQYVEPGREQEKRDRDKERIERLDEAIDENKKQREDKEKKRKEKERDDDSPFKRDPWGRW